MIIRYNNLLIFFMLENDVCVKYDCFLLILWKLFLVFGKFEVRLYMLFDVCIIFYILLKI